MSWIESHQELRQHPKTRRLARLLGCSLPTAIGHLHMLWWWAVDYAPLGELTDFEDGDIADASEWDADPVVFVSALTASGFLDRDETGLSLHDWKEYGGKFAVVKAGNRIRKQRERDRKRDPGVTEPRQPRDGAVTVTGVTPPQYRTVQEITGEDTDPSDRGAVSKKPTPRPRPEFRELTDLQRKAIESEFIDRIPHIPEEIDRALAHDAARKSNDMNLYVRGWLRRTLTELNGKGNQHGNQNGRRSSTFSSGAEVMEWADELESQGVHVVGSRQHAERQRLAASLRTVP